MPLQVVAETRRAGSPATVHEMTYRGVRIEVGQQVDRARKWAIFPDDGPIAGAVSGAAFQAGGGFARGSFKEAVLSAQRAIDQWLEQSPDIA